MLLYPPSPETELVLIRTIPETELVLIRTMMRAGMVWFLTMTGLVMVFPQCNPGLDPGQLVPKPGGG